MTSLDHIARVAEGLTKAQRRYLLGRKADDKGWWPLRSSLRDKGLLEASFFPTLSPLGLAVRNHLLSQDKTL